MFKRTFAAALSLSLPLVFSAFYFHARIDPSDREGYRKLVEESASLQNSELERSPIRQLREGVRKELFQGEKRMFLESAKSKLTISQKGKKIEAIEMLDQIAGRVEEDGQIRSFAASKGICDYSARRMTADGLKSRWGEFDLAAQEAALNEGLFSCAPLQAAHPLGFVKSGQASLRSESGSPLFLEGGVTFFAMQAPFSVSSNKAVIENLQNTSKLTQDIRFYEEVRIETPDGVVAEGNFASVKDGKMRLFPKGGERCTLVRGSDFLEADEIRFDFFEKELLCLMPSGWIEEQQAQFQADTALAFFEEKNFQCSELHLEGGVSIASYESKRALADSAHIFIPERKTLLQSAPGSRVLFLENDLKISAHDVQIREAVQGFGDVRLFFHPEEKSKIEKIFSKYL